MSREFQLKEIDGKKCITYPFQSIREIDDIILQLLNDADMDGFLKSRVIKADKELAFDIGSLCSLEEIPAAALPRDRFISLLEDLKNMLEYLEEAFIGPEYISFDTRSVFMDPDSGKLYLTVLPLQNPGHDTTGLQEMVKNLVNKFSPEQPDAFYDFAASKASVGISRLSELENLISRLKEEAARETVVEIPAGESNVEDAPDRTVVFDKEKGEELSAAIAAAEAVIPPAIQAELNSAETEAEEPAEEVSEEAEAEETAEEVSEEPVDEGPEEMVLEVPAAEGQAEEVPAEAEAAECAVEEVVSEEAEAEESAEEVSEEAEAEETAEELSEEPAAEAPAEEAAVVPMAEEQAEEVPAETEAAEEEKEIAAEPEKVITAYLFRKKSSELIPLSSEPFVIGKIPMACDYVITDNPALSRIHAIIRYVEEEEAFYIIDCNSTNHVYLNGVRVLKQQIAKLTDKDRIHLATEEFVFHLQK